MVIITVKNPEGKELVQFTAISDRTILEQIEEMKPELLLPKTLTPEELKKKLQFEMPFSCRAGACMTCCVVVKKGMQCLDQTLGGEKFIDTDDNQFLTCIGGVKKEFIEKKDEDGKDLTFEVELEMLDY